MLSDLKYQVIALLVSKLQAEHDERSGHLIKWIGCTVHILYMFFFWRGRIRNTPRRGASRCWFLFRVLRIFRCNRQSGCYYVNEQSRSSATKKPGRENPGGRTIGTTSITTCRVTDILSWFDATSMLLINLISRRIVVLALKKRQDENACFTIFILQHRAAACMLSQGASSTVYQSMYRMYVRQKAPRIVSLRRPRKNKESNHGPTKLFEQSE